MEMKEKYAELLVKTGINIQKGQTLVIACPIESAEFSHIVQKAAYRAGAREVITRWIDEKGTRIKYDMADDAVFDEVPDWLVSYFNGYADKGAGFLSIMAPDPDLLKGVDPKRIARFSKASSMALRHYRERTMSNRNAWCVASVPSPAWTKKVFPDKSPEEGEALLWDAIYKAVRVDTPDPVAAWKEHHKLLTQKRDRLNSHQFQSLRYKNSIGTDLTVRLPDNHIWFGCGDVAEAGHSFTANMPTEEVYTAPHRDGANGRVVASMPLNYHGNLVEDFWFEFKDGVVIDFDAKKGKENIKELLNTDEGAKRLGEVALVQYDSPISNMGILFYNTLYDENASCHFALGNAYPTCLEGGTSMSKEELQAAGLNESLTHVDFMLGTSDLEIDGITADGKSIPVFRNGNFAL